MTKNSVSKLCVLSVVLVGFLNSNSYNSSAMMGSRFRSSFNGMRNFFSIRRTTTSSTSSRNLSSSRFSLINQNRLPKPTLNRNLVLTGNSALVQTSNPRHSQIKPIPNDASLVKTITNSDGFKIVTGVSEGNYFSEAIKDGKIHLRSVSMSNRTAVTEWFSEGSDSVKKREIRTSGRIITTKFLDDGSSEVNIK